MSDAKPDIRFCVNNPRSLAEREDLISRGFECRDCLNNCDRCFETRFLEIENDHIECESYTDIIDPDYKSDPKAEPNKES